MTTRRAFLAGLAAASLPRVTWAEVGDPVMLAAGKLGETFVLHGLSATGASLFQLALPARGHAAAAHPTDALAVAFARRPGTFALVLDCASGAVRHRLTPPEDRQFSGHGAFSADGALLMTSEVVAEGSAGRIGLWDTRDFTRIGAWDSHGIGPHDIRLLADGRMVVANGGIQTDPQDRSKLNLATMRPNLALLGPDGALLDRVELAADLRQNSIRHLACVGHGVAFAMQWEGDKAVPVPQLGLWTPGAPPVLCPPPDDQAMALGGYAGSIAATSDLIAVTSALAGAVMIFDTKGGFRATFERDDLSGVAAIGPGFMATDGQGAVWVLDGDGLRLRDRHTTLWDNHLVALV
jgi:uncharacterized protein